MAYDIDPGDLTPPLVMTITDTAPINTGAGVVLRFTDEAGNVLFTDNAPGVNATDPLAVVLTHNWVAGQTDVAGTYGVQAVVGGTQPYPATGPIAWTIGAGQPLYCTVAQARAAGATGTDAEVTDAIRAARRRIDRHTGDTFAPTTMEVVGRVSADGTVLLPRIVRSVDRVTPVGRTAPLGVGTWRALSSRTPGQVDAVLIGGAGVGDPLIAGAEPWNGGWANLLGGLATGQVEVVGSFGWDEPPVEVAAAAAMLAASIRAGELPITTPTGPDTDDEGNVVKVTVGATAPTTSGRTTGHEGADALLAALHHNRTRLAGV